jgi:hypothetical protein
MYLGANVAGVAWRGARCHPPDVAGGARGSQPAAVPGEVGHPTSPALTAVAASIRYQAGSEASRLDCSSVRT